MEISGNPTLDAILALTLKMEIMSVTTDKIDAKMGGMATKKDFDGMQKKMVSKDDLHNFQTEVLKKPRF